MARAFGKIAHGEKRAKFFHTRQKIFLSSFPPAADKIETALGTLPLPNPKIN
jgi:hypothetical protein